MILLLLNILNVAPKSDINIHGPLKNEFFVPFYMILSHTTNKYYVPLNVLKCNIFLRTGKLFKFWKLQNMWFQQTKNLDLNNLTIKPHFILAIDK